MGGRRERKWKIRVRGREMFCEIPLVKGGAGAHGHMPWNGARSPGLADLGRFSRI